jgi:hypothetical protein
VGQYGSGFGGAWGQDAGNSAGNSVGARCRFGPLGPTLADRVASSPVPLLPPCCRRTAEQLGLIGDKMGPPGRNPSGEIETSRAPAGAGLQNNGRAGTRVQPGHLAMRQPLHCMNAPLCSGIARPCGPAFRADGTNRNKSAQNPACWCCWKGVAAWPGRRGGHCTGCLVPHTLPFAGSPIPEAWGPEAGDLDRPCWAYTGPLGLGGGTSTGRWGVHWQER